MRFDFKRLVKFLEGINNISGAGKLLEWEGEAKIILKSAKLYDRLTDAEVPVVNLVMQIIEFSNILHRLPQEMPEQFEATSGEFQEWFSLLINNITSILNAVAGNENFTHISRRGDA